MHKTNFIIAISYLRLKLVASRLLRDLLADRDMYAPIIEVPPKDAYDAYHMLRHLPARDEDVDGPQFGSKYSALAMTLASLVGDSRGGRTGR